MTTWWWVSVPYTLLFVSALLLSGGTWPNVHLGGEFLFALSWLTSLSSAAWALVNLIRIGRARSWTGKASAMLISGFAAGLWLLQPLGFFKWLLLR
jgi:hypothetical protein